MKRAQSAWRLPALGLPGVAGLLAAFLVSQYAYAWRVPFINDDYVFLDLTRAMPWRGVWAPHLLWVGRYYRPWSRELHYWTLQHLFGVREGPFHGASFALWLGVLLLYYLLVRRLAGTRAAGVATAGAAALAAWGLPVVWAAGAQDLWMLLFAVASLLLFVQGRALPAALAYALALLSKETAALLPVIALAFAVLVGRRPFREGLRRAAPLFVVGAVWAALHPQLGGRLWHLSEWPAVRGETGPLRAALGTLLAVVNLDGLPRPEFGWRGPLLVGAPGALALAALAWWALRAPREPETDTGAGPRLAAAAGVWAVTGWLPLLLPSIGWHAYYGLFGMLGAWLLLGTLLARRRALVLGLVAALALLRATQAATVSRDWGDEWYQRRAAEFIGFMRHDLLAKLPAPPRHSRLYFSDVPSNVGFLQGDGPALRVWYGDSTVRGGLLSQYRVRPAGSPPGPDRFFRFDSTAGWIEIRWPRGVLAVRGDAAERFREDHERLAIALSRGENWPAAAAEYAKLATIYPDSVTYAYYAGLATLAGGDSAAARAWLGRAADLPGADEEIRAAARELQRSGLHPLRAEVPRRTTGRR